MAGAVGRVAGAADRGLAVVAGVAAEAALVDLAVGRPVERQAHLLQVEDGVDGLLRQDLGGVLVDQVVTALDRVEGVPLPVVLLHVGERGGHAALRGAGVGAGGVELREHGGAAALRSTSMAALHAGAAGADDDGVVLVVVDAVDDLPVSNLTAVREPSPSECREEFGEALRWRPGRVVVERGEHQGAEHDEHDRGGGASGRAPESGPTRPAELAASFNDMGDELRRLFDAAPARGLGEPTDAAREHAGDVGSASRTDLARRTSTCPCSASRCTRSPCSSTTCSSWPA